MSTEPSAFIPPVGGEFIATGVEHNAEHDRLEVVREPAPIEAERAAEHEVTKAEQDAAYAQEAADHDRPFASPESEG